MAPTKLIEFSTFDGVMLRGNLYLPNKSNAPVIIMVNGLTFLKEHIRDIPDRFRDAGYAVLAYDHRSFGSSNGTPRHHIDLDQQSDDIWDAVTWVGTQSPTMDPNKIVLWGAGHGAGLVMPAGAHDPRVTALLCWIPFMSGHMDAGAWPKGHAERMLKERVDRVLGKASADGPEYVPIFPDSLEAAENNPYSTMIGPPQAFGFHAAVKASSDAAGVPWENKMTLQSLFRQQRWEPTVHLPKMSVPTLYITARDDEFNPHEQHMKAYEKIAGPRELLVLESENLAAFVRQETREQMLSKTLEFLGNNL